MVDFFIYSHRFYVHLVNVVNVIYLLHKKNFTSSSKKFHKNVKKYFPRARTNELRCNKIYFADVKTILNEVSGRLRSGELCAIMGPSGKFYFNSNIVD